MDLDDYEQYKTISRLEHEEEQERIHQQVCNELDPPETANINYFREKAKKDLGDWFAQQMYIKTYYNLVRSRGFSDLSKI